MRAPGDLLIRDVRVEGQAGRDVRIRRGRIVEIGEALGGREPVLDGAGGWLVPGLIDHHLHLLAWAAMQRSVRLDRLAGREPVLARALAAAPGEGWVRAVGYHDSLCGPLDRERLDRWVSHRPVRVQYSTGSLWVLNSAALALVLKGPLPPCVELDETGRATGRIWRGDAWLRGRLADSPPSLAGIGAQLAAWGVTGVTDASAATGPAEAALLAQAVRSGALPQRLTLMSAGPLEEPDDGAFALGPVKLLLDEHSLPDFDELGARFAEARARGRRIAVHCVTAVELAFILAAFETFGARPGDRLEHGGIIPEDAIPTLARLGLTVVTQPAFVGERGDRYLADVDPVDQPDLYRCASLLRAGVRVAGSSDAPYASADPWAAIRAAAWRLTPTCRLLGGEERLSPAQALDLFLGARDDPGGPPRRVAVGALADLCLMTAPAERALFARHPVGATIIGGHVVFQLTKTRAHAPA
ncbi:putative amidohydrolase YtcJ [Caulobacter ginsengisoli]|uniref:Amidohydrolase YtcJ n=1 Tax=Caulobacter ginsengisoli TaxID=400775 RepID=A0ABU0J0Z9_9CAUL|nr:amidohydrolase family protein [Caulobacter ginsengisoli]MDQ0466892.1 putative amidohydrolase YtcJ [Caulobacter ginsengisoli]